MIDTAKLIAPGRRRFLSQILACAVAPAVVRYDSLMRPVSREVSILLPFERIGNGWELSWWSGVADGHITLVKAMEALTLAMSRLESSNGDAAQQLREFITAHDAVGSQTCGRIEERVIIEKDTEL